MDQRHFSEEEFRSFLESEDDDGYVMMLDHLENCDSCRERLSSLVDSPRDDQQTFVAANLKFLAEEKSSDSDRTSLQQSLAVSQQDRFEILEEIAEGGMGIIVRAVDRILKRVVALKVMKPGQGAELLGQARFVREARICAALQHPGVVPVHDLGLLHDGRPFLAMKLIEGRTLESMINGKVAVSRLLDVFARVSQTLAYAHSCSVVHRDLKPTNIMVGEFGEVQVMDWGLATFSGADESGKSLVLQSLAGASGYADNVSERVENGFTVVDSDDAEFDGEGYWKTKSGSIFGTPAYMSPEQARGDTDEIDQRADVFALGAILCEIVTGKPPCATMPEVKLLDFAREPDYARLRNSLEESEVDLELRELLFDCLAPDRDRRPEDAGAVSDRIDRWRDSGEQRLRTAELETVRAEARAVSEQKRRKLASALTLAVMLVAATVTALLLYVGQQRIREFRAEQQRQEEIRETEGQIAGFVRTAGEYQANAIEGNASDPSLWQDALHEVELARNLVTDDTSAELTQLIEELEAEIISKMQLARDEMNEANRITATLEQLAEAHKDFVARIPVVEVDSEKRVAVELFERAFATFGISTDVEPKEAKVLFDAAPDDVKDALVFALWEWHHAYRDNNDAGGYYGSWLRTLFEYLEHDEARFYIRRAYLADDSNLIGRLISESEGPDEIEYLVAADCYRRNNRRAEAVALLRKAIEDHPDSFWLNFYLAEQYAVHNEVPMLESAANYYQVCAAVEPMSLRVLVDQGAALLRQSRYDRALEHFERMAETAPDVPEVLVNLSASQLALEKYKEAAENCRRAIELRPKMLEAWINLGESCWLMGNFDESDDAYQRARELQPDNPEIYVSMARAALYSEEIEEAASIVEPALLLAPTDTRLLSTMAEIHYHAGRLEEAERILKLVIEYAPEETGQYVNLSRVQMKLGDFDEAIVNLKNAEQIDPTDLHVVNVMIDLYRETDDEESLEKAKERRSDLMRHIKLRGEGVLIEY
ncbi:MAG: tetratricopeptide repeat protein [Planctomycetota bacterium]